MKLGRWPLDPSDGARRIVPALQVEYPLQHTLDASKIVVAFWEPGTAVRNGRIPVVRASTTTDGVVHAGLIRLGGFTILLGLAIHVVLNTVLKEFPPEDPTASELQAYLSNEASTWAIVHGFRYVAFACIVLFAAGLFSRTCCTRTIQPTGWGVVGLLGTALFVTNGVITNGIEILAFLDIDLLARQQELFWLLFRLTRVLFTAEVVTWSILILGFSIAGWLSATIPKWLGVLGLLNVVAGMLTGVFIVSIVTAGWATIFADVAALTGLAWFACSGVYMLIRGAS